MAVVLTRSPRVLAFPPGQSATDGPRILTETLTRHLHKRPAVMKRNPLTLGSLLACLSISAGLAVLLLSGCSAVKSALDIQNPRYSIRSIHPRLDIAIPLSQSSVDIDFALEVDNPNGVGLRLDQIDFNLFINDARVLDSMSQQNINIPANGRGDVQLRTRIGYQNIKSLWNEMVDIVSGRQRARYELRGNAYYATPVGRLKLPVTVFSTR
ncbi:MAG TPA: LEA type 2 family protein [Thermoanaerobaculia bacterium]|nr:LEA type 2 family protein [Thermoanaerobaculia bacterium]